MAYDEHLARRIGKALSGRREFGERKMFGRLAFFSWPDCFGIVAEDLMVRVADEEFDAAMQECHVRPMDFTGKPLKGFVYVSPPGSRTPAALRSWLARGERFVRQRVADSALSRTPAQRLRRRTT